MITDDIEINKKIFALLNSGIQQEYESFEFTAHIRDGYIETKLWVTSGGVRSSNLKTTFNGAILCSLIEELQASGLKRGDNWKSFSMSYIYGDKVKVKFDR